MSQREDALRSLITLIVREEVAKLRPVAAEYLSTTEAARVADVSAGTIRRWVRRGELTRHQAGNRVRVRRDELERLLLGDDIPIDAKLSPAERARLRFG